MKKKKFIFAFVAMVMALGVMRGSKISQEANVEQLSCACAYAAAECGNPATATVLSVYSFTFSTIAGYSVNEALLTGAVTPAAWGGWIGFAVCGL